MPGWLAYLLCFIGVCGHASSEFVAKLADTPGPEFSVWRFMIGGACLVVLAQVIYLRSAPAKAKETN